MGQKRLDPTQVAWPVVNESRQDFGKNSQGYSQLMRLHTLQRLPAMNDAMPAIRPAVTRHHSGSLSAVRQTSFARLDQIGSSGNKLVIFSNLQFLHCSVWVFKDTPRSIVSML